MISLRELKNTSWVRNHDSLIVKYSKKYKNFFIWWKSSFTNICKSYLKKESKSLKSTINLLFEDYSYTEVLHIIELAFNETETEARKKIEDIMNGYSNELENNVIVNYLQAHELDNISGSNYSANVQQMNIAVIDTVKTQLGFIKYLFLNKLTSDLEAILTTNPLIIPANEVDEILKENITVFSDSMNNLFKKAEDRSEMIATTQSQVQVQERIVQELKNNKINKVEWVAVMDDRTRESHMLNNGKIRVLGESFPNGQAYPGDMSADISEIINCRCVIIPVKE